jgi:hypothetical protein
MMSEVDSISKAYEDMQSQNKRLVLELGNKEDVTIQVASEVFPSLPFFSLSFSIYFPCSQMILGNETEEATRTDQDRGARYARTLYARGGTLPQPADHH